jgi:hypothetical protein
LIRQTNGRVTGETLTRLPHESTFSVAARIMWLNTLPFGQFAKLCGVSSVRKSFWTDSSWIDLHIDLLMGWSKGEASGRSDARWLSAFSPNVWFIDRLRICPECAGALYHSIWYQWKALDCCPLHGCALVETCWRCGHEFGMYEFDRAILRLPYECVHCSASLTPGNLPSVRAHVELRKSTDLGRIFASCLKRHKRAVHRMIPLGPFAELVNKRAIDQWWGTSEMIFQIARSLSADAQDGIMPKPKLSWLLWADENNASASVVDGSTNRYRNRHLEEADLIYMETLSDLKLWLTGAYGHMVPDEPYPSLIGEDGLLLRDAAPPAVMAYMLLRGAWEGDKPKGLHSPIGNARVVRWRSASARIWPTTLSGRGWEAVFLSTFAAFYWRLNGTRPKYADFSAEAGFDTYFQYQVSPVLRISATVFPEVEGLPLRHFDPPRLRLRDALVLLRNAHRHNRKLETDFRALLNPGFDEYGGGRI